MSASDQAQIEQDVIAVQHRLDDLKRGTRLLDGRLDIT